MSRKDGVDVCAVRDRGMLEASDDEVLDKAFEEDRVLVTANVCGFEKLAHARELHAGIVLFEQGGLRRDEQLALMRRVVATIEDVEMANRVLRVGEDGRMTFEDVPPKTS